MVVITDGENEIGPNEIENEILHATKPDSEDDATLLNGDKNLSPIDYSSALQQLLDRIPVSSVSGIQSSFDLELKSGDSVKDAIRMLYENDLFGAPMADVLDPDAPRRDFSYRFEAEEHTSYVFEDQTVADAMHVLWENRTWTVAIVDRQTKKLTACVRNRDIYHLVENDDLFRNRKKLTVGEFIHSETDETEASIEIDDNGDSMIARNLHLNKRSVPKMESPLTSKKSDTLKQFMKQMTERSSRFSFLINENEQVIGMITVRDVILQFAPPCVSSSIDGCGCFKWLWNRVDAM